MNHHPSRKSRFGVFLAIFAAVAQAASQAEEQPAASFESQAQPALPVSGAPKVLPRRHEFLDIGKAAQEDLFHHYWNQKNNQLLIMYHGVPTADYPRQTTLWDVCMLALPTYDMLEATHDDLYQQRLAGLWEFVKSNFTFDQLTGNFGKAPNLALDDTGWAAMLYMTCYKATGDKYALKVVKAQIKAAFDYYKDQDTANGLWYSKVPPSQGGDASTRFKSIYTVGIVGASLDYTIATGDAELLPDTLKIYTWMETHLRRDKDITFPGGLATGGDLVISVKDHLYWVDFGEGCIGTKDPTVVTGPMGGSRPQSIREAGSVSALFGNMGMAVIQARLYKLTGDAKYLKLALETVRALNDSPLYNHQGVYVNDRDAGTNATFAGAWVREVLLLPGTTTHDDERIFGTARSIAEKCRTKDGYWNPEWAGGEVWRSNWLTATPQHKWTVNMSMITGNTVCMMTAAALLESLK